MAYYTPNFKLTLYGALDKPQWVGDNTPEVLSEQNGNYNGDICKITNIISRFENVIDTLPKAASVKRSSIAPLSIKNEHIPDNTIPNNSIQSGIFSPSMINNIPISKLQTPISTSLFKSNDFDAEAYIWNEYDPLVAGSQPKKISSNKFFYTEGDIFIDGKYLEEDADLPVDIDTFKQFTAIPRGALVALPYEGETPTDYDHFLVCDGRDLYANNGYIEQTLWVNLNALRARIANLNNKDFFTKHPALKTALQNREKRLAEQYSFFQTSLNKTTSEFRILFGHEYISDNGSTTPMRIILPTIAPWINNNIKYAMYVRI